MVINHLLNGMILQACRSKNMEGTYLDKQPKKSSQPMVNCGGLGPGGSDIWDYTKGLLLS